jgi:hypothetical protein
MDGMRKFLLATAAMGFAAYSVNASARILDPAKPEDAVEISKRMQCGEEDGKPALYHWSGRVYSRVQGEPDRHLFNGEGMNIRQCVSTTDPKRGKGYRLISREVMLYTDPVTNQVLRDWKNPWTGETVKVMHIANDPVNARGYTFPYGEDGKPFTVSLMRQGKWVFSPSVIPLYYHNVLAGDYQDYIGGKYHAMEIFDFAADADDLLNTKYNTSYPAISWVRVSDWMPWMKQRGRQGQIVINAMGSKVKSFNDLPAVLRDEIALNYPAYTAPPPADDARPNETTWTVFKKMVDKERAASGEKPKQGH